MLIGFYAPKLNDSLRELKRNEDAFGELLGNHLIRDKSSNEKKKSLGLLVHQSGKIGEVCEDMQKKVIELSKRYI